METLENIVRTMARLSVSSQVPILQLKIPTLKLEAPTLTAMAMPSAKVRDQI